MKQGYSGAVLRRSGDLVEKASADRAFVASRARQRALIALSKRFAGIPRIHSVKGAVMAMDFVTGKEGLTLGNARLAGAALRTLHEQVGYAFECATGLSWLIDLANQNLRQDRHALRVDPEIEAMYPNDALIHSEPAQIIQRADGSIVFIDIEGIGMGSRFRDLGFVCYIATLRKRPRLFELFASGYGLSESDDARRKARTIAGITALAYAGFADRELRIKLGLRLLAV